MSALRELAASGESPFGLLAALEAKSREAAAGTGFGAGGAQDWVGVGFRLGGQRYVAAREEVREILTLPDATRVPGAKDWVRGIANVRGQLLPVIDLRAFLEGDPVAPDRLTRALVVNHEDVPAGLVVDEVLGFRRFGEGQRDEESPTTDDGAAEYVTGSFRTDDGLWGIFSLRKLVESQAFLKAAE